MPTPIRILVDQMELILMGNCLILTLQKKFLHIFICENFCEDVKKVCDYMECQIDLCLESNQEEMR